MCFQGPPNSQHKIYLSVYLSVNYAFIFVLFFIRFGTIFTDKLYIFQNLNMKS